MLNKLLFKQMYLCLAVWVGENMRNGWQMAQEVKRKITSQEFGKYIYLKALKNQWHRVPATRNSLNSHFAFIPQSGF